MKKIKQLVFEIFYDEESKHWYHKIDDYFISTLIVLNVLAVILYSFVEVRENFGTELHIFELFSVIIFSAEYLLRLWVADLRLRRGAIRSRIKYIFSFFGMIDFLAILPFYLPLFVVLDLRALRILRLLRILRVLKFGNYSNSIKIIGEVIRRKKNDLFVTVSVTGMILLLTSTLMYEIEHSVQPEQFPNVVGTLWWSVATLTTIGYGDVYPITAWGKILAGITALLGIGIVAIPTGILSSGFMEAVENRSRKKKSGKNEKTVSESNPEEKEYFCPHCGKKFKT
jgi:voltage-gated potassium channel